MCVRLAEYPRTHTIGCPVPVFTDAGATDDYNDPDGGYYVEFDADYDEQIEILGGSLRPPWAGSPLLFSGLCPLM